MVRPTTGRDCCWRTAATVEESTPPDMAMATSPGCVAALTGRVSNCVAVYILTILVDFALRGAARRNARKRFNTEVTETGAQRARRRIRKTSQPQRHRVHRGRKRKTKRKTRRKTRRTKRKGN